jgi:uncharacterized protein YabE (DUF348 family)/3D (Asp-Asp-Asp) domain-containing protein
MPSWLQPVLALVLVAGAFLMLALGLARTGSPLTIDLDGQHYTVRTHATTVGEALRRAGFDLYPEDRVSPSPESLLEPGMVIQVQTARPVRLHVDGQTHHLRTHAATISQLLAEAGVQLGPSDELWLGDELVGSSASLWGGEVLTAREVSARGGARTMPNPSVVEPVTVSVRRATPLFLHDGQQALEVYSTSDTVGQMLEQLGVMIYLGDQVEPALQERIAPGMTVSILRSVPLQISVDGGVIRTRTRSLDVAGALGQEGIALVGRDRVEPGLDAPVHSGMTIQVIRVREEISVEFEPIPFETEWVPDPEVEIDHIRLVREGQIGMKKRRSRVTYENDQEVARILEDIWTEQSPINKTMAYGTKIVVRTLETPDGPIEYWRKMRVYLTSYMPASCGKPKDHPRYGYTRLGWKLKKGIVAVDPTVIPLKTSIYVHGYGIARAGDTGGGVKGKFVDLGFSDDDYQSWHWWQDIYILTPVPAPSRIRWILPDWPKFPDRKRR